VCSLAPGTRCFAFVKGTPLPSSSVHSMPASLHALVGDAEGWAMTPSGMRGVLKVPCDLFSSAPRSRARSSAGGASGARSRPTTTCSGCATTSRRAGRGGAASDAQDQANLGSYRGPPLPNPSDPTYCCNCEIPLFRGVALLNYKRGGQSGHYRNAAGGQYRQSPHSARGMPRRRGSWARRMRWPGSATAVSAPSCMPICLAVAV
jgi:hypothetical protein